MMADTQILSFLWKGPSRPSRPSPPLRIASVVAAEFLCVHSASRTSAEYYPVLPSWFDQWRPPLGGGRVRRFESAGHAARGKHRTDSLVIDLGGGLGSYIEFGHLALTMMINQARWDVYETSIAHLSKQKQRTLRDRMRFLLALRTQCVRLDGRIANLGLSLLSQFMQAHTLKTNLRNSVNDLMILATAIHCGEHLTTHDNVLSRFAAATVQAPITASGRQVVVDFTAAPTRRAKRSLESKGYVNRGWRITTRVPGK